MHAASAVVFFGAALLGYFLSRGDLRAAYALSMPGDLRQPGSSPEQLLDVLRSGRDSGHGELFFFTSFLFQNNLKVAVLALATGVLASVPTILILLSNGLMLGQFAWLHSHSAELSREMWAWILPHGIPELGAIVLAGGAGILLGQAVLRPGDRSRAESLRRAGAEAARTAMGIAALLLLAAIVEGHLRQSRLSTDARFAVAAVIALALTAWLVNGGRIERRASLLARGGAINAAPVRPRDPPHAAPESPRRR
jgi:uncharacterized membrane protein SpoIIM required for sporulation